MDDSADYSNEYSEAEGVVPLLDMGAVNGNGKNKKKKHKASAAAAGKKARTNSDDFYSNEDDDADDYGDDGYEKEEASPTGYSMDEDMGGDEAIESGGAALACRWRGVAWGGVRRWAGGELAGVATTMWRELIRCRRARVE